MEEGKPFQSTIKVYSKLYIISGQWTIVTHSFSRMTDNRYPPLAHHLMDAMKSTSIASSHISAGPCTIMTTGPLLPSKIVIHCLMINP